jgi:hypothetical protein
MEAVVWITDADAPSLDARVASALQDAGPGCRVDRFTYWYTGRAPVHEAVISRPVATGRRAPV